MKRFVLLAFALMLVLPLDAQQIFNEVKYKRFNFGAKVGMNASFPVINTLKVNGTKIDDITMQYRVGYLFSVFGRINMHRFFIEPGASWNKREGNMNFTIPASVFPQTTTGTGTETTTTTATDLSGVVRMSTHSLDFPITFGYNVVKEGAYGLSLTAGPVLKYSYDISYTLDINNQTHKFTSEDSPFGIGIALGVGVSISRLFFDFAYEFGLNKAESEFSENSSTSTPTASDYSVHLNKRINVMSMSLGVLF